MRISALVGFLVLVTLAGWAQGGAWDAYLPPYEKQNLEKNRQFVAQRRAQGENPQAQVGVYLDAGVWNLGAVALVTALENGGLPCRVLTHADLAQLGSLKALVLPGGFAGYQWLALGNDGGARVRAFVENGGHCLGVCAGAYLISRTVRYRSIDYPYPVALFDGVAEGPVAGLPDYPSFGPVKITLTAEGTARGLGAAQNRPAIYGGGPRFVGGSGVTVWMRYADGSAAGVRRPVGKGEVEALGVHLELANDKEGGLDSSPPPSSGPLLRAVLGL